MITWNVTFRKSFDAESQEIRSILEKCHAMASVINNIPITPRRQRKMDSLNILRAVRGTTGIEDANLTEDEVRRIMESPKNKQVLPAVRQREEKEARNAEDLMHFIARLVDRNPKCQLDKDLISTFHTILTQNIDHERNTPGEYRIFPVSAGEYRPPKGSAQIKALMEGFISWFNQGEPVQWDPIIRAIAAHFYIVSIHPFGDGNGRTARAVESFLLYKAGINVRGFYSLANFYYLHRSEYISHLNEVRRPPGDDLTPFILFALKGLASELEEVHKEVLLEVREIAFRDYLRDKLDDGSKPGRRMFEFMLDLGSEIVTVKEIRDGQHRLSEFYNKLNPKTLSRDLTALEENELIKIQDGKIKSNFEIMDKFTAHHELIDDATE